MRINAKAFGLSAGLMAGLVTTLCAAAVVLAPEAVLHLFGSITHLDVAALRARVGWTTYLESLVFWTLLVGTVFAFGAMVYDRLVETADAPGRR